MLSAQFFVSNKLLLHNYLPNPLERGSPKTTTNLAMPFLDYAVFPGQTKFSSITGVHVMECFVPHCCDWAQI